MNDSPVEVIAVTRLLIPISMDMLMSILNLPIMLE